MAGWPWPLASWVAPTAGAEPDGRDRRCEDAAGWTAVHSWTCREVGESGGGRRLPEPGWRHRVQPSRREKSTARRPKRMNSSMAATHSQMAETERIDQECRTTTGARVKGARPQGGAGASGEPAPDMPYLPGGSGPSHPTASPAPQPLLPDTLKGALLISPLSAATSQIFPVARSSCLWQHSHCLKNAPASNTPRCPKDPLRPPWGLRW